MTADGSEGVTIADVVEAVRRLAAAEAVNVGQEPHGDPNRARRTSIEVDRRATAARRSDHDARRGKHRRTDLLAHERAHDRITRNAFDVGRRLQLALEAAHRSSGAAWGPKIDTSSAGDAAVVSAVEATRRAERMLDWSRRVIGGDVDLVAAVLADGSGFAEATARAGRVGRRATGQVAARFRNALERLALAQKATGARAEKVNDKYATAAGTIGARSRSLKAA